MTPREEWIRLCLMAAMLLGAPSVMSPRLFTLPDPYATIAGRLFDGRLALVFAVLAAGLMLWPQRSKAD